MNQFRRSDPAQPRTESPGFRENETTLSQGVSQYAEKLFFRPAGTSSSARYQRLTPWALLVRRFVAPSV